MRSKGMWSYLAVVLSLSLLLAGIPVLPPAAAQVDSADPVAKLVERLGLVYNCLDDGDREVIGKAKSEVASLDNNVITGILKGNDLITDEVKDRLDAADEDSAALKLAPMIREAAAISYSTKADDFENELQGFREDWDDTVSVLLGGGVTLDDAWKFVIATEQAMPGVLKTNLTDNLADFIQKKSYDEVLAALEGYLREAAPSVQSSSFRDSIEKLGWSVDKLVDVKDALRDAVADEKGKDAEQALMKGYIRSVTKPQEDVSVPIYAGSSKAYNLKVQVPDGSTTFNIPGNVLKWTSLSPNIASFDDNDNNNILSAKAEGTVTVRAFHPNNMADNAWLAEFSVTVSTASSGGGGPAPLPGETTETTTDFGQVQIDKATGSVTTTIDASKAADLVAATATGPVVFKAEIPADVTVKTATVELPAAVFTTATTAGKDIALEVAGVEVLLPAGVIAPEMLADPEAKINFSFQILDTEETGTLTGDLPDAMQQAADVIEIGLTAEKDGSQQSITLAKPVTITLPYCAGSLDADKLGIYRYNETSGAWEYKGGRVDRTTNSISTDLESFSKYTVLAYNKTFSDIQGHWAQRDIEIMAARHIAAGVTENTFNPEGQVTRAEFTAFLIRTLGIDEIKPAQNRFPDVQPGAWYYGAVEAAAPAGLVAGYEDGGFRPEQAISRQEMAAMLTRALAYAGKQVDVSGRVDVILAKFSDNTAIGAWARTSAAVAVEAGLIVGRTSTTFVPLGNATRAETVVVLKRLQDQL